MKSRDHSEEVIARAQAILMSRVERLHFFVKERIPADLTTVITPDDILQEIWLSIFGTDQAYEVLRLERMGELDTWLITTTRRKLVDFIRKVRCSRRHGDPVQRGMRKDRSRTSFLSLVPAGARTPSSAEAAVEASAAVHIALCSLREDYRQAIMLHHVEGRSRAEVASIMHRSEPAVHGLLHRGMRKLRQRLGSAGRFFSDVALLRESSANDQDAMFADVVVDQGRKVCK